MSKRLAVCFDGTWNKANDSNGDPDPAAKARSAEGKVDTNVARLHRAVADRGSDGRAQESKYIAGVGTRWFERVLGGLTGAGVSNNMMSGYRFLAERYEPGDEIFIVGFSRGAYTARALSALLAKCGLVPGAAVTDEAITNAYIYYANRDVDATAFKARCHDAHVRFLGVWDTVGALGVPGRALDGLNDVLFEFRDRTLSPAVDAAYHAIAVDEHRRDYEATVWDHTSRADQVIEQRWFAGDHCDVGGGHTPGGASVSDIPLRWMLERARAAGLGLRPGSVPDDLAACLTEACHDTYAKFLGGTYAHRNARHYRPIREGVAGEVVDESVYERREADPTYRPQNPGLRPL